MKITHIILWTAFGLTLVLTGCSEEKPEQNTPQPLPLTEEGTYTITRFETLYTDYQGDTLGIPQTENPFPNHTFTLAGPSHFSEEISGTNKSRTTGSYIISIPANTLKLTIGQPLALTSGTYEIDSLTFNRLVLHLETENQTTQVRKLITIRANR